MASKALVITPTYNEKENIADMVQAIMELEEAFDLLVVDDGSPDGTAQIVKDLQKNYPDRLFLLERSGKLGLGTAYVAGFQWGLERNYEYFLEIDADFSHNPKDLVRLLRACRDEGNDVAVGSRYVTGVNVVNWPMSRVLLSYYASAYVRMITGMSLRDATAGFVCYRDTVLKKILQEPIKFIGYAFQIEMKFKAWKYGFKIKEVPIIFTDRTAGSSKMSKGIVKEAVFGVIRMKIASWFKKWK
ncbi:MAG: dolichol-phosphate mannosyltransferase [Bacteroidia bacterium]|nr:MAG: dolichol-phosphate mannosyltransferase [Bacteroidia bacterium]